VSVSSVEIENLKAYRKALNDAEDRTPRELTGALKAAGTPILAKAREHAPSVTGFLQRSYKLSVSGTTANVVNRAPYAGGAEWGRFGKWAGFARYPGAPGESGGLGRFAWRAVVETQDPVVELIQRGLEEVVTVDGWAT
jgi:hypothetical protein